MQTSKILTTCVPSIIFDNINVIKLMWNEKLLLDLTVPEIVVWECGMKWKEMLSLQQWPGSWTVVMQKRPTDPRSLQLRTILIKYMHLLAFIELIFVVHKEIWICAWKNDTFGYTQAIIKVHLLWIFTEDTVALLSFEFLKLTSTITLNNKINYPPPTTRCSPPFLKPKTQRTARYKILIVE